MNIKVKISGLLAWLFGASGKSEYEVDISPASKPQGDLMRKLGPCTEEKQAEEFERYKPNTETVMAKGLREEYKKKFQDKLERRKDENKIRNDTARSIRG